MLYDMTRELDVKKLEARIEKVKERGGLVEFTEKRQRSVDQNSYYQVITAYFGAMTGRTKEYVQRCYFKGLVNRDLFVKEVYDELTKQKMAMYRSTTTMSEEEMALAIDRFRNWASMEANIYIPSGEEYRESQALQREMTMEIEYARRFI